MKSYVDNFDKSTQHALLFYTALKGTYYKNDK